VRMWPTLRARFEGLAAMPW